MLVLQPGENLQQLTGGLLALQGDPDPGPFERLGVQLLRRTTRRLSLTETGKSYYEHSARILADLAANPEVISSATKPAGNREGAADETDLAGIAVYEDDDKILAEWNGLMISAFARAGFAFAESDYVAAAARDLPDRLRQITLGWIQYHVDADLFRVP